ncbi:hypothetical protein LOK49_LG06G01716 [Camellia lanceoleosa]|uniref:Uncharacterized protein n=1 Tax=Camellia lanceoleosa TaxID=1840588 RepID=A0ACC0H818_9ERIC|nr:hypothetical protein LOK49_LG06G01716 [Camellia lanceoleosa]
MHRVASQGPYAVAGALFIVDYWRPSLVLDRLKIARFVVWVRLHGLPLECFTMEMGFQLERELVRFFLQCQDGEDRWIECRYERIFKICHNCGKIGHTYNQCDVPEEVAREEIDDQLEEIHARINSGLLTQENQPMYMANTHAFAHCFERQNSSMVGAVTIPYQGHTNVPLKGQAMEDFVRNTNPRALGQYG